MKNKIVNEKCLDSGAHSSTSADNRSDHQNNEHRLNHLSSKQAKSSSTPSGKSSTSETTIVPSKAPPSLSTVSTSALTHHGFTRSRSKSSVSYAETSKGFSKANSIKSVNEVVISAAAVKHFNPTSSTNISSSFRNALQMPQNIAQVFPNLNIPNMSSLPDYLPQLPSVSMPSMPAMPNISLTMPSMPSLSMPNFDRISMPNISMPTIPSISNINIPSFSEIMSKHSFGYLQSYSLIFFQIFPFEGI